LVYIFLCLHIKRRCTRKRTFIANFSKKSFLFWGAKEKEYYHSIDLFKRKLLRPVPIAGVNGKGVVITFSRDTHEKLAVIWFIITSAAYFIVDKNSIKYIFILAFIPCFININCFLKSSDVEDKQQNRQTI